MAIPGKQFRRSMRLFGKCEVEGRSNVAIPCDKKIQFLMLHRINSFESEDGWEIWHVLEQGNREGL